MSPKEKQAPLQVAFVFLGPLTNGQPAAAGSRARKRGPVSEKLETKQAAAKQTFVFPKPLTSVPPASAGGTFFFPDTSKKRLGHE